MQATQAPPWQVSPSPQSPQEPPQPSSPHSTPAQSGAQTHALPWQVVPASQSPQDPPQPSSPHSLPQQSASQATHAPAWQAWPTAHSPQTPPQPSSPQTLPAQRGAQRHAPATHSWAGSQTPQVPPQPSSPQSFPVQSGVQSLGSHSRPSGRYPLSQLQTASPPKSSQVPKPLHSTSVQGWASGQPSHSDQSPSTHARTPSSSGTASQVQTSVSSPEHSSGGGVMPSQANAVNDRTTTKQTNRFRVMWSSG